MGSRTPRHLIRAMRVRILALGCAIAFSVILLSTVNERDSEASSSVGRLWRRASRDRDAPVPPDEQGAELEGRLKRFFTIQDDKTYTARGVKDAGYYQFPSLQNGLLLALCAWVRRNGIDAYLSSGGEGPPGIEYEKSEALYREPGESVDVFAARANRVCDAAEAACVSLAKAHTEVEVSGIPVTLTVLGGRPGKLLVTVGIALGWPLHSVGPQEPAEPGCSSFSPVSSGGTVEISGLLCSTPEEAKRWARDSDIESRSRDAGRTLLLNAKRWPGATLRARFALGFACGESNPVSAEAFRFIREIAKSGKLQPIGAGGGGLSVPPPDVTYELLSLAVEENGQVLGTLTPSGDQR